MKSNIDISIELIQKSCINADYSIVWEYSDNIKNTEIHKAFPIPQLQPFAHYSIKSFIKGMEDYQVITAINNLGDACQIASIINEHYPLEYHITIIVETFNVETIPSDVAQQKNGTYFYKNDFWQHLYVTGNMTNVLCEDEEIRIRFQFYNWLSCTNQHIPKDVELRYIHRYSKAFIEQQTFNVIQDTLMSLSEINEYDFNETNYYIMSDKSNYSKKIYDDTLKLKEWFFRNYDFLLEFQQIINDLAQYQANNSTFFSQKKADSDIIGINYDDAKQVFLDFAKLLVANSDIHTDILAMSYISNYTRKKCLWQKIDDIVNNNPILLYQKKHKNEQIT